MNGMHVAPVGPEVVRDICINHHYLAREAPVSQRFGLYDGPNLLGVCCYGTPSSAPLRAGLCGTEWADRVSELTRLWLCGDAPKNSASMLVGRSLREVQKPIVVSFADPTVGHYGGVYQATNWLYTGLSAKRTDWTIDGVELHGQTIADRYTADEVRAKYGDRFRLVPRPQKHRYVFFTGDKRERKLLRGLLRYPVVSYPVGEVVVTGSGSEVVPTYQQALMVV